MGAFTLRSTYSAEVAERLASYSSRGPLLFGSGGISMTAPANPLIAGFAERANKSLLDSAEYRYSLFGGTSGSSPMAMGAAALLKPLNPAATSDEIELAMTNSARKEARHYRQRGRLRRWQARCLRGSRIGGGDQRVSHGKPCDRRCGLQTAMAI